MNPSAAAREQHLFGGRLRAKVLRPCARIGIMSSSCTRSVRDASKRARPSDRLRHPLDVSAARILHEKSRGHGER